MRTIPASDLVPPDIAKLVFPWYDLVYLTLWNEDNCPIGHHGWHLVKYQGGYFGGATAMCGDQYYGHWGTPRIRAATRERIAAGEVEICPKCLKLFGEYTDPRERAKQKAA